MKNITSHMVVNTMDTNFYWRTYKDTYYNTEDRNQKRNEAAYV